MRILGCICLLMICVAAVAEDKGDQNTPKGQVAPEMVDAQVQKVYSCKDGDYKFIAYEVKWKDHEVIVSDPLAKSDYHVGDTVRVLILKGQPPNGNPKYLLNFQIMPPMPQIPQMPKAMPTQPVPTT